MPNEVVAAAVAELTRFKLERLEHIREKMLSSISSEKEAIGELAIAKGAQEDYLDSLADDIQFLGEAEETVGGLLLVGLYSAVEHFTKSILRHRYSSGQVKQFFKTDELRATMARDFNVNLSNIPRFAEIDELRVKNNAVKHGGSIGEPALAAYARLSDAVVPYLRELARIVVPD
jgi:hypothetical protein